MTELSGAPSSRLNDKQQQAVLNTEGPLLILAGAGSGKTTVLIERIAQIIRKGTPPWSILAITFTNKAAGEIKERLRGLLGETGDDVWASTFHAACVRMLRRDADKIGFSSSFTIYDADDSTRLIKEIMQAEHIDTDRIHPKAVLSAISNAKDRMLTPYGFEKAYANESDFLLTRVMIVYKTYQKRLNEMNAMDFDDIIFHTVRLLQNNDEVRAYYQNKFRYVLVDEYQDTNQLQYRLASLLAAKWGNFCVVGDDDQSIYKFRGATIENILNFEKQYPDATVIRLEQNYRSTSRILEAANGVIKNNRGRKAKTLWTSNLEGEQIDWYAAQDDRSEADFIAQTILNGVAAGRRFKDYCLLYRMGALSNRLEESLRRCGVPYRIFGGLRFFDRAEVKDVLAYLHVLRNPNDDVRLTRIINTPARGIGARTVETIQAIAAQEGRSMYAVLLEAGRYADLGRGHKSLASFAEKMESLRQEAMTLTLPELYDLTLTRSGYLTALEAKDDFEARGRIENILELKSSIENYVTTAEAPTLSGFLDEVSLYTDIERYDENADACVMMTMHASKGLEFPVVFLTGMEQGIFPSTYRVMDESEMEEERRLCYVAITRAREKLYITSARQRMMFGKSNYNPVSDFVKEIPAACLHQIGAESEPGRRASGSSTGSSGLSDSFGASPGTRRTSAQSTAQWGAVPKSTPARKTDALSLSLGDAIRHKAFGDGLVIALHPMGGDQLVEIAFNDVGTKKLMLSTASKFLEKK